ncbi:MAG: hypothetical protein NC223_04705 [Butyrivibrio sp.]|nr:hypothetical protein [Butyrivibrio sp.]
MYKWYDKSGGNEDVVLSGRIRLARNLSDYKFASKLEEEEAVRMVNSVVAQFRKDYPEEYRYIFINTCSEAQLGALKERRSISSYLAKSGTGAAILSKDEGMSVMLNAEDHIRIQALESGMNMSECFRRANEIDDYIDANFDYAFDEKYGYKTTYPTNVGTGMKAGYTLHLPALAEAKKISQIGTELGRFGIKIKMIYGDSESGYGNIYQVSSQKTLGQEEREIIKDLDDIVMQIINQEREQRRFRYEKDKYAAEDMAYKSYGVLKYARKLSLRDAMSLLSELMLGISTGILAVGGGERIAFNRLLADIQPAVLGNSVGKALSVDETDVLRAQYLRNNIPDII